MPHYRCINGVIKQDIVPETWQKQPVYEVIRLMDGVPLFFDSHMERMAHSLELVGSPYAFEPKEIYKNIRTLADREGILHQNVRIEIGIDGQGQWSAHLFFVPSFYPEPEVYRDGVKTVTTEIVRNEPHAKVVNPAYAKHVADVKAQNEAYEVIIMDGSGKIAEGSRSNLFFVKDGTLYSAKGEDILMGITRIKILEVAEALGIEVIEKNIYLEDIKDYDGCFLSGTSIHILPIRQVDDVYYKSSDLEVILKLQEALNEKISKQLIMTKGAYENDAY